MRTIAVLAMLALAGPFPGGFLWAADQDRGQMMEQEPMLDQDIYGWELMTREEREEHRNMMRGFKTQEERDQYRLEHHQRMQERARAQGRVLPDMPQEGGRGMGPGGGMGYGGQR